ncbi:MAG: hypothetical protein ACLGSA_14780 [Acidobacteriota bacterium]
MRNVVRSFLMMVVAGLWLLCPTPGLTQTPAQTESALLEFLLAMNPNDPRLTSPASAQPTAQSSFGFSMAGVTQAQMSQLDLIAAILGSAPADLTAPMDFSGFGGAIPSTGPQTMMGGIAQQVLQIQGPAISNAFVFPGFAGWAGLPGVPALGGAPPSLMSTVNSVAQNQIQQTAQDIFGSLFGSAPTSTPAPSQQLWTAPQATTSGSSSSSTSGTGLESAKRYGEALRSGMY